MNDTTQDAIQVTVVTKPFKRVQMVAQVGLDFFTHYLLFNAADHDRAAKQARYIEEQMKTAKDPKSILNMELWDDGSKKVQNRVFKPKEA